MSNKNTYNFEIPIFLGIKYLGYAIQLFNSVYLAKKLGDADFGVLSFFLLCLQYLSFSNFGLPYSTNVLLSQNIKDKRVTIVIFNTTIKLLAIALVIVITLYLTFISTNPSIFSKYSFDSIKIPLLLAAVFSIINEFFVNVFRPFGKVIFLAIHQVLIHVLIFIVLIVNISSPLLSTILYCYPLGSIIVMILFLSQSPIKVTYVFSKNIANTAMKIGINLLVFNLSFQLISMSSRSIISAFYSINELGYYNLGSSLAQATIMILSILNFLFFSKFISIFTHLDNEKDLIKRIKQIKIPYVTGAIFLLYLMITFYPIIIKFLPTFSSSYYVVTLLLIGQYFLAEANIFSTALISKGKEKIISFITLIAIAINIMIGFGISYLGLSYYFISLSSLLAYFIYFLLISNYFNTKYLNKSLSFRKWNFFGILKFLLTSFPFVFYVFIYDSIYLLLGGWLFFLLLNYNNIKVFKQTIYRVLKDRGVLKI